MCNIVYERTEKPYIRLSATDRWDFCKLTTTNLSLPSRHHISASPSPPPNYKWKELSLSSDILQPVNQNSSQTMLADVKLLLVYSVDKFEVVAVKRAPNECSQGLSR